MKFHVFSLFHIQKISCGILSHGGMSHPTNYIGVVRVKFCNFNPTTKLTKIKHPRNLPTVQYLLELHYNAQC